MEIDSKEIEKIKDSINNLSIKIENSSKSIKRVSKKASTFPKFTFLILFVLLVSLLIFGNIYYSKLGEINASIPTNIKKEIINQYKDSTQDNIIENLIKRIETLELKQELLLNSSQQALEKMYFIFTAVSAFLGLFTLFFGYRQIVVEARKDETQQQHDQEMRGLVSSFQENIIKINSLISTLEQSYSYRKEVSKDLEEIEKGLSNLKKIKATEVNNFDKQLAALSNESFELFSKLNRDNFKLDENKKKLENISIQINNIERENISNKLISPFLYFMRSLNYFNKTQYSETRLDLEKALKVVLAEKSNPSWMVYPKIEQEKIKSEFDKLINECNYHLGIINYNLGNYIEARDYFNNAYIRNPKDFKSLTYIPELMFFDTNISFNDVENKFQQTIKKLYTLLEQDKDKENKNLINSYAILKMKEGNCYIKKKISFDDKYREIYKDYEDPDKATKCFWEAIKNNRSPFITFSLAQSLIDVGRVMWENTKPDELFRETFNIFNRKIAYYTEPILLFQANYIMAICARELKMESTPILYLSNARSFLKDIPSDILLYSPINKIPLQRRYILEEIEKFEKLLI